LIQGVNYRSGSSSGAFRVALALAVLLGSLLATSAAKPKPDGPYYIQGTQVNVRLKPEGDIQFQLDLNDKVYVVKRDGEWAYVSIPAHNEKGWVAQQFLGKQRVGGQPKPATPAPVAAPLPAKPQAAKRTTEASEKTADDFALQPGGDLSTQIVITRGSTAARPAVDTPPAARMPEAQQPGPAEQPADAPPIAVASLDHYDSTAWESARPQQAGSGAEDPRAAAPDRTTPASPVTPPVQPGVSSAAPSALPEAKPLVTASNFAAQDGQPAVLYPAVRQADSAAERSDRDFIPDAAVLPGTPTSGTTVAVALNRGGLGPAPSVDIPLAPAPSAKPQPEKAAGKEQGKPSFLFNGDATTVVTSPMMLEGSFFAVGGRDMGKISASDVNLRAKPDTKAKVLGKLQAGDKLYLTTLKNKWYEVSVPGRNLKGWVSSDFVHEFPKVEIKGTQVRLRGEPNTASEIKDTLDKGEVFYQYEKKNGWVKVASSASGINGWIKGEYVGPTDRSPSRPYSVHGDEVNFRASPEVDADIIARLPQGTTVQVYGRNEKWSYIQVQGRYGWMYSEYLMPGSKRGFVVPSSPVGLRLIARARAMEGTPYVWGGESDDGVDCSGLIYKVLLDEGASGKCLPRRASEQMAQLGLEVDKENLQPGDLVFFTTYKPGPSHVGIYLGDGNFIHASSAKHQVAIGSLSERYYKERFVGARRITEDELRSLKPQ
jgi:cell wall-associated NlpC family hydrolase